MQTSIRKYALLGCVTVMVGGCAAQQTAPEYRLSSSAAVAVPGASMLQRGRAQLDAGLDALAIESFRAEIRANPESADAYNGLAVAYGRIGRGDWRSAILKRRWLKIRTMARLKLICQSFLQAMMVGGAIGSSRFTGCRPSDPVSVGDIHDRS